MAEKGFAGRALNAAYHIKAIKDIIKALMNGGWATAGLKLLKHYWPQALAVALILILLPVIIICCLPMTLFGFSETNDADLNDMNVKSGQVSAYFDTYSEDYAARVSDVESEIQVYISEGYTYTVSGEDLPKNRFIAIFSVHVGNDFTHVSEGLVKSFYSHCVDFKVMPPENEEDSGCVLLLKLSHEQIMERLGFSESDVEWAGLLYNTLEENNGEQHSLNSG